MDRCFLLAMHAQDDEAGFQFWLQILALVLAQLAATPEPLLPWLTEEVGLPETCTALMRTEPTPVRLSRISCSGLATAVSVGSSSGCACFDHSAPAK